jgi:hypothetical protein
LEELQRRIQKGGGGLAIGRQIARLKRTGNGMSKLGRPRFRATAALVFGAVVLGTLLLGGGNSGRDLVNSLFASRSGSQDSYICAVVVCPLRMTVDPTTVRLDDSHPVRGRLRVLSDAPQSVILTYTTIDVCTRDPVSASNIQLIYDENAFQAGSGNRGFTIRAPRARKGLYLVTLTGLRGTVSWSTRLTVDVKGGSC